MPPRGLDDKAQIANSQTRLNSTGHAKDQTRRAGPVRQQGIATSASMSQRQGAYRARTTVNSRTPPDTTKIGSLPDRCWSRAVCCVTGQRFEPRKAYADGFTVRCRTPRIDTHSRRASPIELERRRDPVHGWRLAPGCSPRSGGGVFLAHLPTGRISPRDR